VAVLPLAAVASCIADVSGVARQQMARYPHSSWRVNVSYLDAQGLHPIFANDGNVLSVPASNNKMFTTAAAYLTLGEHFTTVTRLYQVLHERA
jgi:D-alanyl-D-alanine carboxypeptidase